MSSRAGSRATGGAPERRRSGHLLPSAVLLGTVLAAIVGMLPLDLGRVSAASGDAGDAAAPVRFVLDDSGFTPSATSAA